MLLVSCSGGLCLDNLLATPWEFIDYADSEDMFFYHINLTLSL